MFQKVQTEKIYMKIVKQIEDLILNGKLKPGMKLPPENELAESFGASRPTVREAICALEILGYIESKKGKGNFIKDFTDNSTRDILINKLQVECGAYEIFETRLILEPESMHLVVENINGDDYKVLEDCLYHMEKGMETEDYELFSKYDVLFHITLGQATHNNILTEVVKSINSKREETIVWKTLKMKCLKDPNKIKSYLDEHAKILDAIKEGDAKKAKAVMRKHILDMNNDLFGVRLKTKNAK